MNLKHEYYRFLSILVMVFFSIAFMFSIYLRLEGKVPPLQGIELGSEMSQVSEVNECNLQSTPCLSAHYAMLDKETFEFQFQMDI